jgi:hypothetical protein
MSFLLKKTQLVADQSHTEKATIINTKSDVDATIDTYRELASVLLFEVQTVGISEQTFHAGNDLTKRFYNFIQGKEVNFRESAAVVQLIKLIEKLHAPGLVHLK